MQGLAKQNYLEAERRREEFLTEIRGGLSPKEACELLGITPATYRAWRSRDSFFAAEVDSIRTGARQFKEEAPTWENFAEFRKLFFGHETPFHQAMIVNALEQTAPGDITMILVPPEHGKCLALDTPIPTPTGWTTMGDVQVGDEVIATDGTPTRVTFKNEVALRDTYRVTLDDKSEFVACAGHRWMVRHGHRPPKIFTTREMAALPAGSQLQIPLVAPFVGVAADLPIHPYVLGVWLGDGHSAGGRFTNADAEIVERIRSLGYEVTDGGSHNTGRAHIYAIRDDAERRAAEEKARRLVLDEGYSFAAAAKAVGLGEGNVHKIVGPVSGRYVGCRPRVLASQVEAAPKVRFFQAKLRDLGVLNNKHIPSRYLRAPLDDRMELLRGLMDTDGWCSKAGRSGLGFSDERLRDDVLDLLCGLGYKPMVSSFETTHRRAYRIEFSTDERSVFNLQRKLVRQKRGKLRDRRVLKIEPVEPVPTQCIQVAHESHSFAIGRAWVYGMNTTLFEDYASMKLATDPEYRITVGCEAQGLSRRILGRIKNRMEENGPFKKYVQQFGPFVPQNMDGNASRQTWSQDYFNVYKRRGFDERDYNMVGIGFGSNIAGSRTDHLHCDDLQSLKTIAQTEKMVETFRQDWLSRPGETGITTINGTRVADGDIYEKLEEHFSGEDFFRVVRLPAIVKDHTTGEERPLWPRDPDSPHKQKGYTMEMLDRLRKKVGEDAWSRNYMQKPRAQGLGTFTVDIVDRCLNPDRGIDDPLPDNGPIYIGLDPALGGINCLTAWQVSSKKLYLVAIQEDRGLARNEQIMDGLESMVLRMQGLGGNVTDVVIEAMNFQRGLARDERLQEMAVRYGFSLREHLTGVNKYDPDIGVPSMTSTFIKKEIDMPWKADERTRELVGEFREQHLRWKPGVKGNVLRQDMVMSEWFVWILWQSRRRNHLAAGTNFKGSGLPWTPTTSGLLLPAGASPFYGR